MSKRLFTIEELATEEGRAEYYRVDINNPDTLHNRFAEPYLNPAYNEELKERYGVDQHGDQIVRIVWAASLRQEQFKDIGPVTVPYLGRKYPYNGGFRLSTTVGYSYSDKNGKRTTVSKLADLPPDAVFTEVREYDDLGARKFVVEMKYTIEHMVKIGWCPSPDTPDGEQWCVRQGKRYRSRPNPTGEYVFGMFIESADGQYRDVTYEDVQGIHAIFNRALTESEEERVVRKMTEQALIEKALRRAEADNDAQKWEDAITRVEKRPRGKVYGR